MGQVTISARDKSTGYHATIVTNMWIPSNWGVLFIPARTLLRIYSPGNDLRRLSLCPLVRLFFSCNLIASV